MRKINFFLKLILLISIIPLSITLFNKIKDNIKGNIYKPNSDFYYNDSAKTLLNSTKNYILLAGEFYYADTIADNTISKDLEGAQIVVVTYNVKESVLSSKIFENYQIGKNDLGILLLVGFEDSNNGLVFKDLEIVLGRYMETFFDMVEMDQFREAYFDNIGTNSDYDLKIYSLYFNLIKETGKKLYNIDESYFDDNYYNVNDYINEQYNFIGKLDGETFKLSVLEVILIVLIIISFLGSFGQYAIIFVVKFIGSGGNKGGGGSTRGYGYKR